MNIIKRVGCAFGVHERSRGKARTDGYVRRSECRHCGVPMVKDPDGWRQDDTPA